MCGEINKRFIGSVLGVKRWMYRVRSEEMDVHIFRIHVWGGGGGVCSAYHRHLLLLPFPIHLYIYMSHNFLYIFTKYTKLVRYVPSIMNL